jgi:hypothetical protein
MHDQNNETLVNKCRFVLEVEPFHIGSVRLNVLLYTCELRLLLMQLVHFSV